MKKQLFPIKKQDWCVVVKSKHGTQYRATFTTKTKVMNWIKSATVLGDKIQIFKLSYEFKDSFVVGEK